MTTHQTGGTLHPSRRGMLRGVMVATSGALLGVGATASPAAEAKVAKAVASYQATPKGNARCGNCTHWQPLFDCKVVLGAVSPIGWCSLYAPKY
jgi:hypothetical protein